MLFKQIDFFKDFRYFEPQLNVFIYVRYCMQVTISVDFIEN